MCPKEFVIDMVWHMIPEGQRDAWQSFIAVPRKSMRPFIWPAASFSKSRYSNGLIVKPVSIFADVEERRENGAWLLF